MRSVLDRLRGADVIPSEFDADFYRRCYADMNVLDTPEDLWRHYRQHGRKEGRFASMATARSHFKILHGEPPADFNVAIYKGLNPDLSKLLSDPIQYELHFLEFGRFETHRPYSATIDGPQDAWEKLLKVHDFNLLNESFLPPGGVGRAEAVAYMKAEGIERVAPIARDWIFDPEFYRAQYAIGGSDAALYRHWLLSGLLAGLAPNEMRAIFPLLGGKSYPECFDWRRFCELRRIETSPPACARISALERLFERPIDDEVRKCIGGAGSSRLYEAVGNFHLIRARFNEASDAFRLAVEAGEPTSRTHVLLGDSRKALGDWQGALASFRHALTLPSCPIWALIHATNIMLSEKMFRAALHLIEVHADRFRPHELFDGFLDEVATKLYQAVADTMHGMISDDAQDAVLDTYADKRLGEITAFLQTTKFAETPLRLAAKGRPRIVVLACLDLAQCTFYRVEQKRRLLANEEIEVEVFDFNDPASFMSALPGAVAAIFYRVPSYPKIVESIIYANWLGIETFFDIDDLVFTRDFPDSFESYENQISRQEYHGLCHGVALYRQAISLCKSAIVSTRALAEVIAPLVVGGAERTFVVPNGLDDRFEKAILFARNRPTPSAVTSIFYGSGTKAHNLDFSEIVAPALLDVLASHPNCRLVIVGYLKLDRRFDPYADRISRFPFIGDPEAYWSILASCDINISVLRSGQIADGKSEIKWLEAAMLGVPSIVSATRTFRDVLTDGETGLLARDTDDWRRHFLALLDNDDLRRRVGARAHSLALREYSGTAIVAKLKAALFGRQTGPSRDVRNAGKRKRILICNVFFSPQSHGGATRVVEDNVEQLLDRYADEFEVSILSTYKGLAVGALRVHSHRGCPVFRIGVPVEVNMDWRPFNDAIIPAFRRVLEVTQPDVVHFHCVQRLTASIVEETQHAGIPYIVTVHDGWWISDHQFLVDQDDQLALVQEPFRTMLPAGVTRSESLHRLQRLKSLLNGGVATLAVSGSFAELYREAGVANVECCENGVSPFRPALAKTTPKEKIVIGHIGGRSMHKGATLVEMALKLNTFNNLELLMMDGTLESGAEIVEMWGATPVTLHAPIDSADIDRLYSRIDVLLAPSIWPESYGLVVREALHFRCWVVASDRGALAHDIVENENGFIVDPSSSSSLATVLKLMDDDVPRFKRPPRYTHLRRSSQQVDELLHYYRSRLPHVEQQSRRSGSAERGTRLRAVARIGSRPVL